MRGLGGLSLGLLKGFTGVLFGKEISVSENESSSMGWAGCDCVMNKVLEKF